MALGIKGKASASLGNFILLAEWDCMDGNWVRVRMGLAKVDGKRIKADTFYALRSGKFVEC